MTTIPILTPQQTLLVFQQTAQAAADIFQPFALTDLLTRQADQTQQGFLHFWEATNTVILGMQDTRVTDLAAGLAVLKGANYRFLARNSGGLAVVADEGILNFSVILPIEDAHSVSIDTGYEMMLAIIRGALQPFKVEIVAAEVPDSYCPGTYDLSIHGKKFAGIAQRRIRNGMAVMIYLSVNGPQPARGALVRDFYQASLGADFGKGKFPAVNPDSMANLAELLNTDLTVEQLKEVILSYVQSQLATPLITSETEAYIAAHDLAADYEEHLTKMLTRNEEVQQIGAELDERTL